MRMRENEYKNYYYYFVVQRLRKKINRIYSYNPNMKKKINDGGRSIKHKLALIHSWKLWFTHHFSSGTFNIQHPAYSTIHTIQIEITNEFWAFVARNTDIKSMRVFSINRKNHLNETHSTLSEAHLVNNKKMCSELKLLACLRSSIQCTQMNIHLWTLDLTYRRKTLGTESLSYIQHG